MSRNEEKTDLVEVTFVESGKAACWTKTAGTLLDLARAQGLNPVVGCEDGWCGTCVTPILSGAVAYDTEPACRVDEGHCLICRALPDPCRGALRLEL